MKMKTIVVVEIDDIKHITDSPHDVKVHILTCNSKRATNLMRQYSQNPLVNVLQGNVHDLLEQLCAHVKSPIEFHIPANDEKSIQISRKRSREDDIHIISDRA